MTLLSDKTRAGTPSRKTRATAAKPHKLSESPIRKRERLSKELLTHPPAGLSIEEVQAHFRCMPLRYWRRISLEDLVWHLTTIHGFFKKLAQSNSPVSPVSADWKDAAGGDRTRVVLSSWDRRGFLEKVAAAFSALRITILRAEVYTRSDDLVLDVFEVCEPETGAVRDINRLSSLPFLVEGAFGNPPRFASVWATQFHKGLPRQEPPQFHLSFDNRKSPDSTILRVEAPDRPGLLYDLLHTLTGHDLEIEQALVETDQELAKDQFYFTDGEGRKVTNAAQLRQLRKVLAETLAS